MNYPKWETNWFMKFLLISLLYQAIQSFDKQAIPSGAPDVILHRLPEFFRLFLSDGLLPDLVYALGLKNV
ncbi:hypothetical protein C4559_04545 [Candidatus Microgenomates bacterium]|nr:MAG: hypothetical protein C4559_04545 [Candidatus Microgenomates bacterium]